MLTLIVPAVIAPVTPAVAFVPVFIRRPLPAVLSVRLPVTDVLVPRPIDVLPLMVVLLELLPTVTAPGAVVPKLVPAAAEAAVK